MRRASVWRAPHAQARLLSLCLLVAMLPHTQAEEAVNTQAARLRGVAVSAATCDCAGMIACIGIPVLVIFGPILCCVFLRYGKNGGRRDAELRRNWEEYGQHGLPMPAMGLANSQQSQWEKSQAQWAMMQQQNQRPGTYP
jgi:hypothetical protein